MGHRQFPVVWMGALVVVVSVEKIVGAVSIGVVLGRGAKVLEVVVGSQFCSFK